MQLNLHEKQTDAFLSQGTEILYGGAAGGGKSHLMRTSAIYWCAAIPNLQVYIFRRTFPDLWKNHMEGVSGFPSLLAEWINEGWVKINYSKNFIQFWNGSKIFLCHLQYEKDLLSYQGAEIHVLLMDELTQFTDTMYRYLRGRVRAIGLNLPDSHKHLFPRILCGANPGGPGHNWVKMTFVDFAPALQLTQCDKKEGGMVRQYIPALMTDNPSLMEDDPDYDARLQGLGNEALVRAMRKGDWDIVAGGMLDDVWSRNTHVLKGFEIPSSWRIDRSFDWGSSKPFSVGWWAETDGTELRYPTGETQNFPKGTLIRFSEWYGWQDGKPNEGCRMLAQEVAEGIVEREQALGIAGRVTPGPADSSIFDASSSGMNKSIASEMALKGVQWEHADKSPGTRKRGWELVRGRLKSALDPVPEDPAMYVTEGCTQFIRTMPTLPRDKKDADDVDTGSEDHIADETRYRCLVEATTIKVSTVTGV